MTQSTSRVAAWWWTEDNETKKETDRVIAAYASYQRRVLRARAKPAVARLVEWRRAGGGLGRPDEDEDEDEEDHHPPPPHTGAITTVLGVKVYKEGKRGGAARAGVVGRRGRRLRRRPARAPRRRAC